MKNKVPVLICKWKLNCKVAKKQGVISTKIQKLSEKDVLEFVLTRFDNVKQENKIKNLVSFQAMNKYMLMAHDQNELKVLGNLVASYKKKQFAEILIEYEKHLKIALGKKPTIKTHSNVLMHIFGYFSKDFSQPEKEGFFELLTQFKEEKIQVGEILSSINPMIYRFDNTYLANQTYFLLYANPHVNNLLDMLIRK